VSTAAAVGTAAAEAGGAAICDDGGGGGRRGAAAAEAPQLHSSCSNYFMRGGGDFPILPAQAYNRNSTEADI